MGDLRIKRIYDAAAADDGKRFLVDRLWPRGMTKDRADLDGWWREVAPSTELRKSFGHQMQNMEIFRAAYIMELEHNTSVTEYLTKLREFLKAGNVTLLYAAKDEHVNHAVVLQQWLKSRL